MKHSRTLILPCFAIAAILAGCTVEHEQISATSPPAAVATAPPPTVTTTVKPSASPLPPTQTAAPSQTPSPTPGIQLPDDLLFDQQTADCQLPCWHGLRVGESDLGTVQATLNIELHVSKDLFAELAWEQENGYQFVPGFVSVSWGKTFGRSPIQRYSQDFWITDEDELLRGIVFNLQYEPYTSDTTLERIIHELGRPDYLLTDVGVEGNDASIAIMSVYKRGIAFLMIMYVPRLSREDNVLTVEYCTDAPYPRFLDNNNYLSIWTKVYLVAPFENLSSLDALQQHLIADEISDRELVPIQNIFNVDVEQLYSRIENDQTVCLQGQRVINFEGVGA